MAPAHDPYAANGRRPRRSGLLPDAFEAGARGAGATDADLAQIRDHWWRGTPGQRAEATEVIGDLSPEEWVEFLEGWRKAMADPDWSPWGDDNDQEGTSDASEAQDSPPADEATDGADGLAGVQVTLELPDGTVLPVEGDLAEFVDPGPVRDGYVRVGFMRPTDDAEDGTPMGYGMTGDVPTDAKAAIAFIAEVDGGGTGPEDRARLVLAAELQRPAAGRRKKVLAAVAATIGDDEVNDTTRTAGEGLGG